MEANKIKAWAGATLLSVLIAMTYVQNYVYTRVEGDKIERVIGIHGQKISELEKITSKLDALISILEKHYK